VFSGVQMGIKSFLVMFLAPEVFVDFLCDIIKYRTLRTSFVAKLQLNVVTLYAQVNLSIACRFPGLNKNSSISKSVGREAK